MREIKFRAWDTIGKQWLRITGFETAETDVSKGYTIFGKGAGLFHDGDYVGSEGIILSQYTGLKDKNGKEIYEGDIVKGSYYDNFSRKEFDIICIVRWDKSGYWNFDGRDIRFTGGYLTDLRYIEVIGNIYENPELLEVKVNENQSPRMETTKS